VIGRKILARPSCIASFVRYLIPLTCTNVRFFGFFVDVTMVKIIPYVSFALHDFDDKSGNYYKEIIGFSCSKTLKKHKLE
jgi:hypothetical protein